jgi:hypothetical protein
MLKFARIEVLEVFVGDFGRLRTNYRETSPSGPVAQLDRAAVS